MVDAGHNGSGDSASHPPAASEARHDRPAIEMVDLSVPASDSASSIEHSHLVSAVPPAPANGQLMSGEYVAVPMAEASAIHSATPPSTIKPPSKGSLDSQLAIQALPPLLLSVCGFMFTGFFLDIVQHWKVFTQITELFIMVPVLMNLKGNLEMNLACRLSTAANVGALEQSDSRWSICVGNLYLVQFQAITFGLIVGVFSWLMGGVFHREFNNLPESMLMITACMLTASISGIITGLAMCLVVTGSHWFAINPDNIATPLAGSLGDLSTLLLLSATSRLILHLDSLVFSCSLAGLLICLLPHLYWGCRRNPAVSPLVFTGGVPILISLLISGFSGLVFERFGEVFVGLALFLPVINGKWRTCGNLTSVYASRTSTGLYSDVTEAHGRTRRTLFVLNLIVQMTFLLIVRLFSLGHVPIGWSFLAMYILISSLQTVSVLSMVERLVNFIWQRKLDPDTYTLPILSSVGDLGGTVLLVAGFFVLRLVDSSKDIQTGQLAPSLPPIS